VAQCALIDIGVPDINGYVLAAKLRTINPDLRLIAMSGYGRPADKESALLSGFDAHLTKPVESPSLLAAIAER
jgi:CheY-like chemotaxis protein